MVTEKACRCVCGDAVTYFPKSLSFFISRYGFTNMRYIASLISGVGIFMMGAGLSWYHGIMGLLHPHPIESLLWVSWSCFLIISVHGTADLIGSNGTLWNSLLESFWIPAHLTETILNDHVLRFCLPGSFSILQYFVYFKYCWLQDHFCFSVYEQLCGKVSNDILECSFRVVCGEEINRQ